MDSNLTFELGGSSGVWSVYISPAIYFLTIMENFKHHTGRENSTVSPFVPSTQIEGSPTHIHPLSLPLIRLL